MRRADNLTTFMCRLFWNLGASTSWNPQGLSRPVMELLYLYLLHTSVILYTVQNICGWIHMQAPALLSLKPPKSPIHVAKVKYPQLVLHPCQDIKVVKHKIKRIQWMQKQHNSTNWSVTAWTVTMVTNVGTPSLWSLIFQNISSKLPPTDNFHW